MIAIDSLRRLVSRLRRNRRLLIVLPFVVFLGWILAVTIIIHETPLGGEGSPDALAAALASAIQTKDAPAADRLIADSPNRGTVADFLAQASCGSGSITVTAVVRDRGSFVQISSAAGQTCGQVPIEERDGRWYVDPWTEAMRR